MIQTILLPILEEALNHYVRLDPELPDKLQRLSGKVVAVSLDDIGQSFYLNFLADKITVTTDSLSQADTQISGSTFALFRLSMASDPATQQSLLRGQISMTGDVTLGHEIKQLFDGMEIDWEEKLAGIIGDMPAHYMGEWGRRIFGLGQHSCRRVKQDITDYLQEEIQLMPPREELNDFFTDVDSLRVDADRIFARFSRLAKDASLITK